MHLTYHMAQRIVEHIAADLDLAFWIVDRSANVLAGTPDAAPPLAMTRRGTADQHIPLHLPLCYAGEVVGELILVDRPPILEVATLARTLAELIIHQMATFEQLLDRQWALDKFVSDLLCDQFATIGEEVVWQEAKLLGIDLALPRVAVTLQTAPLFTQLEPDRAHRAPANHWRAHEHKQVRQQLLRQLQHYIGTDTTAIYSFINRAHLVGLLPITPQPVDHWRLPIQRGLQQLLAEVEQSTGLLLSAGIGEYHDGWQALPCSYRDAQFALATGSTLHGAGRAFTLADLGLAAFVCNDNQTTTAKLATHLLRSLLGYPELLETLDTFLQANLSPSLAAQQLHIHRHTLTYRLNKITDLSGLDPRKLNAAAQFLAALLWYKVETPSW